MKSFGGRFKPLHGLRFGLLTAEGISHKRGSEYFWRCRCECGGSTVSQGAHLRSGATTSCGCMRVPRGIAVGRARETHGQSSRGGKTSPSPEYNVWRLMRQRCADPKHKSFRDYGGRGIAVCDRWSSFESFLADMGPRPSRAHSIEREDNDGNYEPDNCRWATRSEQQANRRTKKRVAADRAAYEARL